MSKCDVFKKDDARIKNLCVKNETVDNSNIRKSLFLPHINVPQTNPNVSDLAVDKVTGNLYYSNGKDWYLVQPTREIVNGNINEQETGDYPSLNSFFDLFQGSPTGFGTANLSLGVGTYNLNRSDILFRINQLNISGDLRDISGMSYVNGKRANLNNQPLLGKSGSETELLFENDTVTINVEELDLTKVSLVPGDKVYIFSAVTVAARPTPPGPAPALEVYTIKSVESNKIILTTKLSDKILTAYTDGSLSPSITFCPNRIIETDIETNFIFNISLKTKGIWFLSKNNTQYIFNKKFECDNCLLNATVFTNESLIMKNSSQIVLDEGQNINYALRTKVKTVLKGAFIISEKVGGIAGTDSSISIKNSTFLVYNFYLNGGGKGIIWLSNCTYDFDEETPSGKIDQGFIPINGGSLINEVIGPMFYFEKGSGLGIIQDINCENVSTIVYITDTSNVEINDSHLKFTIDLNNIPLFDTPVLWYAEKGSQIFILRDTYNFEKFKFNIYEAKTDSEIRIFSQGEYINNPSGIDFTYKSEGNSIILVGLEESKRWPGNIIETTGGKVLFAPTVDFTFAPNTGFAPLEVQFTNLSTGVDILDYFWDFGDGNASTDENPSYIYQKSGKYTIKFTVRNRAGNSSKESEITIN